MNPTRRPFGFLSQPRFIAGASLLAAVALGVLLWAPWERRGIADGVTLRLHCAAGMYKPVAEILRDYQRDYGVTVEPGYGGTGELFANIKTAGGDLFLAADETTMRKAQKDGLVAETIPVAVIRPVLIVNRKTLEALRAGGRPITSASDLLRDDLRVMLGAPTTTIGQVTRQALTAAELWPAVEKRAATTGTVNNVAETVSVDDRFAGVVWDATAAQYPGVVAVRVPELERVKETVFIGVLKSSKDPTAALQFARYLSATDRGLEVFRRHNFTAVEGNDVWAERPKLNIAAGAMLQPAVAEVFKRFEAREGVTLDTTYNGCGVLVAQMKAAKSAAPGTFPDAYLACDTCFLDDVQQWFGPGVTLSANDAVLIVPHANPKGVASLGDLARPGLRVGLTDPEKSALGLLTEKLLKKHGLHAAVLRNRVVATPAAHDLVNQMRAGALDAAIVYRSNVLSSPHPSRDLKMIEIDDPASRAHQPFAVAAGTRYPRLLGRLLDALTAADSAARFRGLGFHWQHKTDPE